MDVIDGATKVFVVESWMLAKATSAAELGGRWSELWGHTTALTSDWQPRFPFPRQRKQQRPSLSTTNFTVLSDRTTHRKLVQYICENCLAVLPGLFTDVHSIAPPVKEKRSVESATKGVGYTTTTAT
jgi:hypothetical protein